MNSREYLRLVWTTRDRIADMQEEQRCIENDILSLSAIDYSKPHVGGKGNGDISGKIAKLDEMHNEVMNAMNRWYNLRKECDSIIGKIKCGEQSGIYQRILRDRYLRHYMWHEIAEHVDYSIRGLDKVKIRALEEFDKVYQECMEVHVGNGV